LPLTLAKCFLKEVACLIIGNGGSNYLTGFHISESKVLTRMFV
jgi:hypothetical protein